MRTRGWPLVADGALAAALLGIGLVGTWGIAAHEDYAQPVTWVTYALVAVAAVALAVRRVWPYASLAIATGASGGYLVLGYPYGPILLSLLVAVYTVARYKAIRPAVIAAALSLAFLVLHTVAGRGVDPGLVGVVPASAWVVVPFAVGVTVRVNREVVARNRAEWARRHVDEERLRVAQEVHDVVGHGLSAIAMQAEIALHVLPKRPEHAMVALTAISRTSREALDELRVALAGVRGEGDADALAPLPGLARLDALVLRMSDSGVPVRVESTGARRSLPGPVDLAAYRVIQEALTNVLRHAGGAPATVRLGYGPDELTVEVTDTGPGPIGPVVGHGVAGMRQRVAALGGTLDAGPATGGGFRVQAWIPLS